jgi:hypothetical protein
MELLKKIWAGWKAFGQMVGDLVARVVLSVFYFTILVPFGLGVRLLSDPLGLKGGARSLWQTRTTGDQSLAEVKRQY